MVKKSPSVLVFTRRNLLKKRIRYSFPADKLDSFFASDANQLIDRCKKADRYTLFICEYTKEITLKSLRLIAEKNHNLEIIFVLPRYKNELISIIAKQKRFDFVVEDDSMATLLKHKIESAIKSHSVSSNLEKEKKKSTDYRHKYSDLLNNMIIGLYRTTPDGKITMLNDAGMKLLGYKSVKELKEVDLQDEFYDPYKLRSIFKQQMSEKGEVWGFENRWHHVGGKLVIVRENAKAVKDKKGNILYYEGTFEDITEQVQTEQALDEAKKKLHLILEVGNIGIWNWNIKANEIIFSREFHLIMGYLPGEITSSVDAFLNLFHTEDKHFIITDLLADVTKNKPDFETAVRAIKKTGELRWMFIKGKVTEWSGRIPLNLTAVQMDITDRKLAETKIIESETRFRELAENIEEIFWLLDDKEVLYISPAIEKIWGISPSERSHLLFALFRTLYKEDRKRIKQAIKLEVLKGPGIFDEEFRIIRPDGEEKWIWARTFPIQSGNSGTRSLGIAEDITARKKLQLELESLKNQLQKTVDIRTAELLNSNLKLVNEINKQKLAEEKIDNQLKFFRTLLDTAMSPIYIKDTDKRYIDCNKAFEEYFNETRNRIMGKTNYELFPLEIAEKHETVDDSLLQNPGEITYEETMGKDPNSRKEYMVTKSTFLKADGKPGGIIGFVTDITQKKKLEVSIQKALNKEKELLEVKAKLISTASHEFRTPLTTILSSVDLIEIYRKRGNDKKFFDHTGKIKSSVKHMTDLLNDVMTINKTEAGRLEFEPGEINIVELCREIIDEVKAAAGKPAKIIFNYDVPDGPVMADKKLLRLIISNLLNNAVKYSNKESDVNFDIKLNEEIVLRIKDKGIGIPKEEFPMMFEPFHRGINASNIAGTGLGLSIVKRCVELHNGKISFESDLDKGTTFIVQIPIITNR
jgi:PAS domain S-box-containing protein